MALCSNESEHAMATDYDAPRKQKKSLPPTRLRPSRRPAAATRRPPSSIVEENDTAEGIDLPGADLSDEELTVVVVPEQSDEFTCSSCFLVRHRSQVALEKNGLKYCTRLRRLSFHQVSAPATPTGVAGAFCTPGQPLRLVTGRCRNGAERVQRPRKRPLFMQP